MSRDELEKLVITLEEEMYVAAEELRFEYAAKLRDEIKDLRRELNALRRSDRDRRTHVQEHPHASQLRAARDRGGGAGRRAPVRAQDRRMQKPSRANEAAFARAVEAVAEASRAGLLADLVTSAPPRDREREAARARARAAERFARCLSANFPAPAPIQLG